MFPDFSQQHREEFLGVCYQSVIRYLKNWCVRGCVNVYDNTAVLYIYNVLGQKILISEGDKKNVPPCLPTAA